MAETRVGLIVQSVRRPEPREATAKVELDGPAFADGSSQHGVAPARPGEVTATLSAVRIPSARRDEEDTEVDATADRLGRALARESELRHDPAVLDAVRNVVALVPPNGDRQVGPGRDAPLPRLTARLRRPTIH